MYNDMYERLKKLYLQGRLTEAALKKAVTRGWIAEEELQEILDSKKEAGDGEAAEE